ncbi:MAG: AmmeMemoRadiSam system protein B [Chloroflexi bacterium RBG_16_68_14]|nr:MAG: AmmeMemoRadiSam system protein B [Chloroflexi bacterium RBG_16_68_14]
MKGRGLVRKWAALALLPLLMVPLLVLTMDRGEQQTAPAPPAARDSHPALFFDGKRFFDAVRSAESVAEPEGPVVGGIIPHHLLPGHLITGFFRGLAAGEAPETVILIGPNHDNEGRARALTSKLPWRTPFGLVEPDRDIIRALTATGLVAVEDAVLTTEHSVAGIMPAMKYYLPEARVVPIILSGEMDPAEAQRLGEALAARWSDGTVFVASVDFSHDLIQSQAERHDALTLKALRETDAATLFKLDNRYLDSPPAIATLMAAMTVLGADHFVLLENTNSGALLNDELAPTTSYVLGYYRPGGLPIELAALRDCPESPRDGSRFLPSGVSVPGYDQVGSDADEDGSGCQWLTPPLPGTP